MGTIYHHETFLSIEMHWHFAVLKFPAYRAPGAMGAIRQTIFHKAPAFDLPGDYHQLPLTDSVKWDGTAIFMLTPIGLWCIFYMLQNRNYDKETV